MNNIITRFFLTISASWIFVIIYCIKVFFKDVYSLQDIFKLLVKDFIVYIKYDLGKIIILIIGTLVMIAVPLIILKISSKNATDEIQDVKEIELVDSSFIPSYIGYFFIAISADNFYSMAIFYIMISIFIFFGNAEYFNPIFLILGYHMYKVKYNNGFSNVYIFKSKQIIRDTKTLNNKKAYRINDLTLIGKERA